MSASPAALSRGAHSGHWLEGIADPVRLQILRSLSKVPEATAAELADRSPASYRTLRRHLDALEALDVVRSHPGVSDGESSGRPAARFSLSPDVRDSIRATFERSPRRRR